MVPSELSPAPGQGVPIVVVCGATGSGKGALARALAQRFSGEIVSADSRKVYRRFDVGTAKPKPAAREGIRYHLLDVCEPDQVFSASRFRALAAEAIAEISERGRLAIVCGGTGLYLRALLGGIIDTPPRSDALRGQLLEAERAAPGTLHRRLSIVDPQTADRLPPGDLMRLVRALEVFEITGRPLSALQAEHEFAERPYRALQLIIDWPRAELYSRIDSRVLRMMSAGWLEETRRLLASGVEMVRQVVGYRQLVEHLEGRVSLAEAVAEVQRAHRRYARQQLTWFRREAALQHLPGPADGAAAADLVAGHLAAQP